jgi:hypothetical protein
MMINQKGVEASSESHTHTHKKKTGVRKYPVSQDFFSLSLFFVTKKNYFQLLLLL